MEIERELRFARIRSVHQKLLDLAHAHPRARIGLIQCPNSWIMHSLNQFSNRFSEVPDSDGSKSHCVFRREGFLEALSIVPHFHPRTFPLFVDKLWWHAIYEDSFELVRIFEPIAEKASALFADAVSHDHGAPPQEMDSEFLSTPARFLASKVFEQATVVKREVKLRFTTVNFGKGREFFFCGLDLVGRYPHFVWHEKTITMQVRIFNVDIFSATAQLVESLVSAKSAPEVPLTDTEQVVFDYVSSNPGQTGKQIAAGTGVSEGTLSRHVFPGLEARGLRNKRGYGYYVEK